MKFFNKLALIFVLSCFTPSSIHASVAYKEPVERSIVPKKEKRIKYKIRLQSKNDKFKKATIKYRKQRKITNNPSFETKLGRFFFLQHSLHYQL
jgi:hypothetical protein